MSLRLRALVHHLFFDEQVPKKMIARPTTSQQRFQALDQQRGTRPHQREFTSRPDVLMQLEWFNQASELYTDYSRPLVRSGKSTFAPQVYFIRR
jgi:hypothetical protein